MEKTVSKVGCIFIPVTDVKRSTEWYMRMFDMEPIELLDYRAGLAFPNRETLILLWKVEKPQTVEFDTGINKMPYYNFNSYDIHQTYRQLQAKGATVNEIHEMPGYRFFEAFDPDNNPVSIVEETTESPYYVHKQKFRKHT